jgi:photosystem II stability/assembly factor-like uncharacterized protein
MKWLIFNLVIIWVSLSYISIMAQQYPWIVQNSGLSPSLNPYVKFSVVNENICWGIRDFGNEFIRTTNGGETWEASVTPGTSDLHGSSISALNADTAWVLMRDPSGNSSGGIFKTTDGGNGWIRATSAFQASGGIPIVIHFFNKNDGVAIGEPNGGNWEIYTTSDGGGVWIRVPSQNIPLPLSGDFAFESLFASYGNNLWFGTWRGSLYRTTDKGITWSVVRNIFGDAGFVLAFKDSLHGVACTFLVGYNRVSWTSDGGTTWTSISGVPQYPDAYYISSIPGTSSYVITSPADIGHNFRTNPGSLYSPDDGETWFLIDSIPHGWAAFHSLTVGWSSGNSDTVYKWIGQPSDVNNETVIVREFSLMQNYPNPFNPSTSIKYQVSSNSQVSLKVYDVLGNEVATLVNEEKPAGSYEVKFDASGLTSGIYFYTLATGSFIETKKMVLLK